MNKHEKVIIISKRLKQQYKNNIFVNQVDEVLQELVERATPKKVIYCVNSDTYECDDCGRKLSPTSNYCARCGQAIDWSE
jgi:methionyl-tRNA synthetase